MSAVVPEVGDYFECILYCTAIEQTSLNVLCFQIDTITTGAPIWANVAEAISKVVGPIYKTCLDIHAKWYGVGVRYLDVAGPGAWYYSGSERGFGVNDSELLPRQVCGMFTKTTALAGRHGRGRMYVAFPPESGNNAALAVPEDSYMATLDALAAQLTTPNTVFTGTSMTLTLDPQLVGRILGVPFFEPIIGRIPRQKWATHRTRGSYGKPNAPPF